MGMEESKSSSSPPRTHNFPISQRSEVRAWSVVHLSTLEQWKRGVGESANFPDRVLACSNQVYVECSPAFCLNRQTLISLRKSQPVFSFRKRCKVTKMAEHFEYNHIPAQLSSIQNFHFKSVLCAHSSLVVLHLSRNRVTQLGLVDLGINKFLGVFGRQRVEFSTDAVAGEISPDESRCLVRLPSTRNRRLVVFQLYDLRSKDLLSEISLSAGQSLFAFDPRFTNSRLAVTNFDRSPHSLSLVNLTNWEALVTCHHATGSLPSANPFLMGLVYSRAGHLLMAMCTEDSICRCSLVNRESSSRRRGGSDAGLTTGGVGVGGSNNSLGAPGNPGPLGCHLLIFHADSLQRLKVIRFDRYTCPRHSCPVNHMPIMSPCGGRMALVVNTMDLPPACDLVAVHQLPQPVSLQAMARQIIWQVYSENEIFKLGLPGKLLNFVQFKPSFTCAGSCISRSSSTLTSRNIDFS